MRSMAKQKKKPTAWGERLREIRRREGRLTQAEAAARVSVSVATWRNWEQGRVVPNPAMAKLIGLVFPD
jgi:DNA-binding transcriptional regulator YiaG